MRAAISLVLVFLACRGPHPAAGQSGQNDQLRVPDGFKISIFAQNLQGVRFLALGPDKAIYASQPASGLIVKLTDRNTDGVADTTIGVAQGLHGPFGIAFRGDTMYVAEERDVIRFDPGRAQPVTVISGIPSGGHSTRTILFGPDGKLYFERRLVLQPVR
jgi:glucose/arabinose dehydrogenase